MGQNPLYGLSRAAVEGYLEFSKPAKLEYRFAGVPSITFPASFEIAYSFDTPPAAQSEQRLILELGNDSWILPYTLQDESTVLHYAVPWNYFGENTVLSGLSISLTGSVAVKAATKMRVESIAFTRRWLGFYRERDSSGNHIYTTPFVLPAGRTLTGGTPAGSSWIIDPSTAMPVLPGFSHELLINLASGNEASVAAGGLFFEASPYLERLQIPAGFITSGSGTLSVSGDRVDAFSLDYAAIPPFPLPITADPGVVLAWSEENWRDSRYEVFRWEQFPSLLIFDFADYAVQDKMLKRLAFFVEKTGFRGRLAPDSEIASLHGWNAHDYRAEDLARFFRTARETVFPLLAEERELEKILLNAGIIREDDGGIQGGEGGIVSISRESPEYLRFRFMAHEGFHGLFFIDNDFREFSRSRWGQFPAEAKRFLRSFFGFQQYDIADEYLLINEFMAHVLQQPATQAGYYFGVTLPSRLENSWRRADLPAKDQVSNSYPTLAAAFTNEAAAFSGYVARRWGLAAGRVHLVTVRQP